MGSGWADGLHTTDPRLREPAVAVSFPHLSLGVPSVRRQTSETSRPLPAVSEDEALGWISVSRMCVGLSCRLFLWCRTIGAWRALLRPWHPTSLREHVTADNCCLRDWETCPQYEPAGVSAQS